MNRTPSLPEFNRKMLSNAHGGEHTKNKRKTKRPFDPKQALHVVLRSSKARGKLSMLHPQHCNLIRNRVDQLKKRWDVAVYRYANVGNHLHLLVRAKKRADWQGFIRELAGCIAMIVTGARKGIPGGFWDHLVFTRIVKFGRDFKNVARYVCINLWEGSGIAVRKLLAKGQRILEMSEDGFILVSANAPPGLLKTIGLGRKSI